MPFYYFFPFKCELALMTNFQQIKYGKKVGKSLSKLRYTMSVFCFTHSLSLSYSLAPVVRCPMERPTGQGMISLASSQQGPAACQQARGELWSGTPKLSIATWVSREADPPNAKPWDDCSPGQYHDCNLMRHSEPENPAQQHLESWPRENVRY